MKILARAVAIGCLGTTLLAQTALAEVTLRYQFVAGTRIVMETTTNIKQKATVGDIVDEREASQTQYIETTVGERHEDGTFETHSKVTGFVAKMKLPTGEFSYDSRQEDPAQEDAAAQLLKPLLDAVARSEWTTTYSGDNSVLKVRGSQEALKKLSPEAAAAVREQFEEKYLKQLLESLLDHVPARPLEPGDSWTIEQKLRFGLGQFMTLKMQCTYQGEQQRDGRTLDRFEVVAQSAKLASLANAPTLLKITDSDLKIAAGTGETLFDRELGMIVRMQQMTEITGTVEQTMNGSSSKIELDLRLSTEVKQRREQIEAEQNSE